MTIGQKMRFYRTAEGYTQADIAGLLGVERSTYTYYETGKTQPDLRAVLILSRFYGITMELLADDGQIPFGGTEFLQTEQENRTKRKCIS